jgi:acetyltransferase-like isoleucine patch superfamily enzyme
MMRAWLNLLVRKLGRNGYEIDLAISSRDIFLILSVRGMQVMRGLLVRPFLGGANGLVFVGKRASLRHKHLIFLGRNATIDDGVAINALSHRGVHFGDNLTLRQNVIIDCTGVIRDIGVGLTVGDRVGLSPHCYIQVRGPVTIGNDVILGPHVKIFSENHNFGDKFRPINGQGESRIGVSIGNGVWIGSSAIILDGVTLGDNCVVAAGSVVTKSVVAGSVVAGVPARVIKQIESLEL